MCKPITETRDARGERLPDIAAQMLEAVADDTSQHHQVEGSALMVAM